MLDFSFGIDEIVTIFAAFHIFKGRLMSVKAGILLCLFDNAASYNRTIIITQCASCDVAVIAHQLPFGMWNSR